MKLALAVALLLGSFASGCALPTFLGGAATPATAEAGKGSLFAQPWRLHDEEGEALTLSRWEGRTVVVSPVYTACEMRCPGALRKLKRVEAALVEAGVSAELVLYTLDPFTDTPARLRHYREENGLGPRWHLVSASAADTRAMNRFFDVRVVLDGSHIDHDARIAVYGSDGSAARSFSGWAFDERESVVH